MSSVKKLQSEWKKQVEHFAAQLPDHVRAIFKRTDQLLGPFGSELLAYAIARAVRIGVTWEDIAMIAKSIAEVEVKS